MFSLESAVGSLTGLCALKDVFSSSLDILSSFLTCCDVIVCTSGQQGQLQSDSVHVLIVIIADVSIRSLLEARGLYDKQRKIVADGDTAAIPLTISSEDELAQLATSDEQVARCVEQFVVKQQDAPSSSSSRASAAQPRQRLKHVLDTFLSYRSAKLEQTEHEGNTLEDLKTQIPQRWEKYGDLVLLPEGAFSSPRWQRVIGDETTLFWNVVAEALDVVRLGILHPIADNGIREARVALVLGSHGVVQHVDNGIVYSWDVTRCMYSSGNITEKIRIAGFDCSNEVVVDLFAGIGYFTLPYLKHANAKHVYACEWNPEAIKALKNNLTLNKVRFDNSAPCNMVVGRRSLYCY